MWKTTPDHVSNTVLGAGRSWWLGSSWPGLAKHGYSVSQLAVDPANANICYSAGRSGVVATRDGGATWHPAMNGLDGSEIHQVQAGPRPGEGWATDTDWTGIHTLDHWRTCTQVPDSDMLPPLHAASLVRERHGVRYEVALTNPRKMLVNGFDVASTFFRSACITPTDLAVSSDGRIYIGLYGGGVLVRAPLEAGTVPMRGQSPYRFRFSVNAVAADWASVVWRQHAVGELLHQHGRLARRLGREVDRLLGHLQRQRRQRRQLVRELERARERVALGERRSTRPITYASPRSSRRPRRISSFARAGPTIRVSRSTPPELGMIPRPTSGRPNVAVASATRRSVASASSRPPPRQ